MTHIIAEIAQNKHNTKGGVKKGGVHFFENVDPPTYRYHSNFRKYCQPINSNFAS